MRYTIFLLAFLSAGSCKFTQEVQDGRTAYELKQYAVAVDLLIDEYAETQVQDRKATLAYYLGASYKAMNNDQKALDWYKKAVEKNYGKAAIIELAYAYKSQENYPAAVLNFELAQREYGKDPLITREIGICRQAGYWVEPDNLYKIVVDEMSFNSKAADYSPVIYGDEYLLFTSDRDLAAGDADYNWTGNKFSDIFLVNKNGGNPVSFDERINTEYNEGTPCFTRDFQKMFFTRCYNLEEGDQYCRIMSSEVEEGSWTEPVALSFVKSTLNYGHPTLIENDSVMVFSAQSFDGATGYDLYYSVFEDNEWSLPDAMPTTINTQGDEKFPSSDGDTLYFSSNYLPGLGGLDIFKTYLLKDGRWAPPFNLKAPFNSGSDDFGLAIDRTGRPSSQVVEKGYFSSTRNSTVSDQIFSYQKLRMVPIEEELIDTLPSEEVPVIFFLAGRVVENQYSIENDPNSKLIGKVPLENATADIMSGEDTITVTTDEKGRFLQEISRDKDFLVRAKMRGFLANAKEISSRNINVPDGETIYTINVEIALDKLIKNQEILLENIFYDFDRWDIREDAQPSLNSLAEILKNNPEINILLASHTDCQGNSAYNQNLSQKRAQSAIRYLMTTGIISTRLQAKGYGESKLAVNCDCDSCTEDEHQRNRRTTFTIL